MKRTYNKLHSLTPWSSSIHILLICFLSFCFSIEQANSEEKIEIKHFAQRTGRIAFTYREKSQEDIYCLDFDSFEVYPLVTGKGDQSQARWSPDGKKLAYISEASGKPKLLVKNIYEEELSLALGEPMKNSKKIFNTRAELASNTGKNITKRGLQPAWPDWSPDGAYIVFQSKGKANKRGIYVINNDGRNLRRITKNVQAHSSPRWSPRGTEILYTSKEFWPGWDIALYEINEKRSKTLTKGVINYTRPDWHPSGNSVAFSYGTGKEIDIWQLEKGTRATTPLIQSPGREYEPEWIALGEKLIFSAESAPGSGRYELFIWNAETSEVSAITKSKGSIRQASWTALPSIEHISRKLDMASKDS